MSSKYVLDASALLRFIEDTPGGARVQELLFQLETGHCELLMSAVNWGEVYFVICRKKGEDRARWFSAKFRSLPAQIVPADYPEAENAAYFRKRFSLSYADAFAASLAASQHATLITGDYDFKTVADTIPVEFLPAKKQ